MTGAPPQSDMTVVVTGNRIATLAPSRAVRTPMGGLTLDATGKFLIPGLWDMHVHAAWSSTLPTFGPLFLVNGVTGVREMWGSLDLIARAHIRLAQHRHTDPRFSASGHVLTGSPPLTRGYRSEKSRVLAAQSVRDRPWRGPTVSVLRGLAHLDDTAFTSDPRLQYMSRETRDGWNPRNDFRFKTATAADFARTRRIYAKQVELVGLLHRVGVPILAGTDVLNPYCFPGFSLHDELALLVEAGLTPMEALQAATRNPAIFLKATDSLGTIAAGKLP